MMKLLGLIMKRPSDSQIRSSKIVLGIMLILTGIVAFSVQNLALENTFFGFDLTETAKTYLSYSIIAI